MERALVAGVVEEVGCGSVRVLLRLGGTVPEERSSGNMEWRSPGLEAPLRDGERGVNEGGVEVGADGGRGRKVEGGELWGR